MRKWAGIFGLLVLILICAGCSHTGTGLAEPGQTAEFEQTAEPDAACEENWTESDAFYYAYTTLQQAEEQQLYREILGSLTRRDSETELSTLNQDLLEPVFMAVMADHPEIFYVDGYNSTAYMLGSELVKLTFAGTCTMSEEEIVTRTALLQKAADCWSSGLTDGMDDYAKVRYLYEYLVTHTEYEQGTADSQNICSVLLNGRSVCQGYAKTLQYLCQRAGIPALLVTGQVKEQGHAWNLIRMGEDWYHVDPTWGDASYLQNEDTVYSEDSFPAVNYDYFGVTTKEIARTHSIAPVLTLPECTAQEANYYRREGLYLSAADFVQIKAIFAQAIAAQQETVTFRCADEAVYQEVHRILIEEQKVFDCLPQNGTKAVYTDSEKQLTFSFWLS